MVEENEGKDKKEGKSKGKGKKAIHLHRKSQRAPAREMVDEDFEQYEVLGEQAEE